MYRSGYHQLLQKIYPKGFMVQMQQVISCSANSLGRCSGWVCGSPPHGDSRHWIDLPKLPVRESGVIATPQGPERPTWHLAAATGYQGTCPRPGGGGDVGGGYLWGILRGAWKTVQTPGPLHGPRRQGVLKMSEVGFPGQGSSGI